MRRFRRAWRRIAGRRLLALVLVPSIAITTTITATTVATSATKPPRVHLESGTAKARYGHSFRLSGAVPGGSSGRVVIDYRRLGSSSWSPRRHLGTDVDGRFSTPIKARRSGVYRARSDSASASRSVAVAVRSRVAARAKRSAMAGGGVRIHGVVKPGVGGRRVTVHVGHTRIRARTNGKGRFHVRWRAGGPGRYPVRVVAKGDDAAGRSGARAGRVTVFRQAVASWYGPGLYGNGVACGGTLQPGTLGVANKSLPCGAKVTLRYHGHQVTVPVIDRGPYVAGRDYDLTGATRDRLHVTGGVVTLLSSR